MCKTFYAAHLPSASAKAQKTACRMAGGLFSFSGSGKD